MAASKYKDDDLQSNVQIEDDMILQRIIKVSANDCERKRNHARLEKINELRNCLSEENSYQKVMNDFIDFEEHLLEDATQGIDN